VPATSALSLLQRGCPQSIAGSRPHGRTPSPAPTFSSSRLHPHATQLETSQARLNRSLSMNADHASQQSFASAAATGHICKLLQDAVSVPWLEPKNFPKPVPARLPPLSCRAEDFSPSRIRPRLTGKGFIKGGGTYFNTYAFLFYRAVSFKVSEVSTPGTVSFAGLWRWISSVFPFLLSEACDHLFR